MSGEAPARDPYLVKSVVHASRLLSAFRSSGEALPLREIAAEAACRRAWRSGCSTRSSAAGWSRRSARTSIARSLRPFKQKLLPARLRRAGHRLPVLQGGLDRASSAPPPPRASS